MKSVQYAPCPCYVGNFKLAQPCNKRSQAEITACAPQHCLIFPCHCTSQVVLMGDVVQKRQALEVLMSYNPFWLRLAAEVVTQKPVQMQGE